MADAPQFHRTRLALMTAVLVLLIPCCWLAVNVPERILARIGWFFDWGLDKEWGNLILVLSSGFYLACLGGTIVLLRQVGQMLRSVSLAIFSGTLLIGPMLFMAWQSVDLQWTSAHYQESTHIRAVITACVCFGLTLVLWFIARCSTAGDDNAGDE
jgi:hypothetical protein